MSRSHTPEELQEIDRILELTEPLRKQMREAVDKETSKWEQEIANLQKRIFTEYVDVDLGGGDTIAVRTCLLDSEVNRLAELESQQAIEKDSKKLEEISCEMLETITANPMINKAWLMENKDKYSPNDLLSILLGFMEVRLKDKNERMERIRSAMSFRAK